MSCPDTRPAPLRCPTKEEIIGALRALLPIGRAWQTSDGGPRVGTVLYGYWAAFAELLEWVNARFCALRYEFFCATHVETHDLWMAEYGLPDPCDPFPDLCVKVAALGGATCDYFSRITDRLGWKISCGADNFCGSRAGCNALAGRAQAGGTSPTRLVIRVYLGDSPSYVGKVSRPPLAGRLLAGMRLACPPDVGGLKCIMDRIAPAHITLIYIVVPPPVFFMVDAETFFVTDENDFLLAE